jgi:catechol 2,3-dioxygenase-like lactoylglutathione lyase family enzyme
MLSDAKAVAFIQVRDAARARAFYEGVLGLPITEDPHALIARVGDCRVRITALPNWEAGQHPVFAFEVSDLGPTVQSLRANGTEFIRYDFLGEAQDADGVWTGPDGTRVAWFADPDGNLLMISTHAG